jgi:hypothetical protein
MPHNLKHCPDCGKVMGITRAGLGRSACASCRLAMRSEAHTMGGPDPRKPKLLMSALGGKRTLGHNGKIARVPDMVEDVMQFLSDVMQGVSGLVLRRGSHYGGKELLLMVRAELRIWQRA